MVLSRHGVEARFNFFFFFFLISFVYLDMLVCIRSCILTDTVRVYKQGLNIDNRQ